MVSIDQATAVVTGGGSGIGQETALEFAERGANVVVADLDVDGGEGTVDSIEDAGGDAIFVETDVADPESAAAMVDAAVDEYGSLDCAFNNAGIGGERAPVDEYAPEDWSQVIDVNLVGVFNCMKAELERMKDQESGGAIVNNSSILGKVGFATSSAYSAAKHGVLGLTKSAALENGETGVRINSVCPGFIETPLIEESLSDEERAQIEGMHAMNRLGTPEEVAAAVVWLCSDEASFVTGEGFGVEGGYLSQ
ncbi:SDR family NAD(P)-dependent oxidoreductase [Halopiger xanaduensis]|uniref:3-oxoacyl-(Acyl-carrier-protein) reductase n=1 Tax=Halopiger xanaduensis (strain DSM 18323 / JCM 14033 / SH-6) TaxID=797210 RepID=F8D6C1_HALXS|nr:SDR family oxidoreductase [Halopiger xanaduensis]AEH35368.1 3-oxoacyl-(acyl-carrier-protein) reductase [Halopiger xanaduensis SH-6]